MTTLNASLRIRCKDDLITRLKAIANVKGEKYQTMARRELERHADAEESKIKRRIVRSK